MMRKLAYIFATAAFLGAATPASAQFFFVGGDGFGFGIGASPYYGPWWDRPAYRSSAWWGGPVYRSAWWGGPVYRSTAWWDEPAYRSTAWWGGPVRSVAWGGPSYREAFAFAPGCRTVSVRRILPDGRTVIRRSRVC